MALSRRAWLKGAFAASVSLSAGGAAYSCATHRAAIRLTRTALPVAGLPDELAGLRLGMLTDIHRSHWVSDEDVQRAVALLNAERPDLTLLAGDYVTWGDRAFVGPAAEGLSTLSAPHGVFAVLGNHDDERQMSAALEARGMVVLKDRRTRLTIRGAEIDLVGIRFWTRRLAAIRSLLKGAGRTVVLLAHDPRRFAEAQALKIPLILSGHTHGGQVVLPLVGAVAARKFPVVSGIATEGGTTIFVSRGVGTVYVPVRINCPPEVAILTLQPAPAPL